MKKINRIILYKLIIGVGITSCLALTAFICDKDVSISPPLSEVQTGFLSIQSEPEGAAIYLNGRNTGRKTPDSLTYLNYDFYQITLKKQYFRDTSIIVKVEEGVRIDTSIDYLANPLMHGNLNISSTPDSAQIFINDSATGYLTPSIIYNLIPGEYSVKMKKTGFRDGVLNHVAVESNKTNSVYSELSDTTIWVDFQVSNSNIPTNVLSCITADQNGMKWIGTSEYGVLKFDGNNFIGYDDSNSPLPGNFINCIAVDPSNKIWVGTENGLATFDRNNWTIYTTSNSGLPNNSIKALAFEGSNIVWIGTSVGLVKFDGSWEVYTISSNISNWVTAVSVDQENTKWLSVTDTSIGAVSFNGSTFTNYPIEQYHYLTKQMLCSAADPTTGTVWFGCSSFLGAEGGLSNYDGNGFNNFILSSSVLINNLFINNSDIRWVSANDGLYKITGTSQITKYNTVNSPLPSNEIKGSVEDNEGILWIVTGTAGLVKYKGANSN